MAPRTFLFSDEEDACLFSSSAPKKHRNSISCGTVMKLRTELRKSKTKIYWYCPKHVWWTTRTVSPSSTLFSFETVTGKRRSSLELCSIMEMIHLFVHTRCTFDAAVAMTGHSRATIFYWWNLFREVCTRTLDAQPMMHGTFENPVQIDESYFSGKRKYHRGSLLSYDKKAPREENSANSRSEVVVQVPTIPDWHGEYPECPKGNINYGNRVAGPWVVGFYKSAITIRFTVVDDRKSTTLFLLIQKVVENIVLL